MLELVYDWRRYWYPRQHRIPLTEDGFLYVLPSSLRSHGESRLDELGALSNIPCLILLGEPGLGKSNSLRAAYDEAKAQHADDQFCPPLLDLKDYGEFDLGVELDRILDGSRQNTSPVPLFVDSLDEARLRVATVLEMIARRLERSATLLSQVRLRIACRAAEWRQDYEDRLKRIWAGLGDSALAVYVLAPLQEADVSVAAAAQGFGPDVFLREVRQQGVGPLAAVPITLGLLFAVYRERGHLVGSRRALYGQGCLELCRDIDPTHQERDLLDPRRRLAIARRVAALTVFTNRPNITSATNMPATNSPASVSVEELAGGIEYIAGERIAVSERLVRETIETGLFTGTDPVSWSHRSYGEFLAATYAHEHLSGRQVKNLLFHSDGRLVSQLRGTAAWLVAMDAELLGAVVRSDPEVALRSDVFSDDDAMKEQLTASLLQAATRVAYDGFQLQDRYSILTFGGLGALLRPYLTDPDKPLAARVLAVDMAEACQLHELLPELTTISLDDREPGIIRLNAAHAVIRVGDGPAKATLKPLALLPEDSDDPNLVELKYAGIEATWPAYLSAPELFQALNPPGEEETVIHGGDLAGLIVPHLPTRDYPVALAWVAHQPRTHEQRYAYLTLADSIVLGAWKHIDSDAVAEAFADTVVSRLMIYDTIVSTDHIAQQLAAKQFMSMVRSDIERRHKLIQVLVPKLGAFRQPAYYLVHSRTPLALIEDLGWLIEQFGQEDDPQLRSVWVDTIQQLRNVRDVEQTELLYAACEANPALDEALGFPFRAVALDSAEAARGRQRLAERKQHEREIAEQLAREIPSPSPIEYVLQVLEQCEAGKPEAWWRISHRMIFMPDGRTTMQHDSPVLEETPVWQMLDVEARVRILIAAVRYVVTQNPSGYDWFGSDSLYFPVVAGYRAFSLLLRVAMNAPDIFAEITPEIWSQWSLVLVYYTCGTLSSRSEPEVVSDRALLAEVHRRAPQATSEAILKVIQSAQREGDCYRIEQIESIIDSALAEMLFKLAESQAANLQCRVRLLGMLMRRGFGPARSLAETILERNIEQGEREEAVALASLLVLQAPDAAWGVVWPAIQHDAAFGRRLIECLADGVGRNGQLVGSKLSDAGLGNLLSWLLREFPGKDCERPRRFHAITIEEKVAWFQNAIQAQLRDRATPESLQELQRIALEFPEWYWDADLLHATELVRNRNWNAPQPSEILRLAKDPGAGLVESREQLLELVLDALTWFQDQLQGQYSAVYDLWNDVTCSQVRKMAETVAANPGAGSEGAEGAIAGAWREVNWRQIGRNKFYLPKDEEHLSDYVARYLSDQFLKRGIVINREVRVRRDRTDIHINTFSLLPDGTEFDPITVVIEVKGCWNARVRTAMEEQLVDQYLRPLGTSCTAGVYLVGMFNCPAWFENDPRRAECRNSRNEQLQAQLDLQAAGLLIKGLAVRVFTLDARLP
jgi:hypothetical protein